MRAAWALAVVGLVACGGDEGAVRVDRADPPYGPVIGGTRITLEGSGFTAAGTTSTRVQFDGRDAPLVATLDDGALDVIVPPGDRAGDVEVVVLSGDRIARATGIFRYSAPPTITSVEPADVLASSTSTRVTVSGTGFADEGAGDVTVVLDGQALFADVLNDRTLTFVAPPGRPLVEPDLEVLDRRGRALVRRAFRYAPSLRPGLLLFPRIGAFAVFFDPADLSTTTISWFQGATIRFSAVVLDARGDYWALDRARRWGRLDMKAQRIEAILAVQGWMPTVLRVGRDHFALDRSAARFGRFDPGSGQFSPIGDAPLPCCGSYGLATDGATTYFTARGPDGPELNTVDPATGEVGTPVPLLGAPAFSVEEMRFFGGTLYAVSRDNTVVTIDPATGEVTALPLPPNRYTAMELYVPR